MGHFYQKNILYLLWAIVFVWIFLSWGERKREKKLKKFVHPVSQGEINPDFSKRKQFIKNWFLVGVFFFSIIALARPQWGFRWELVKRQGLDILLVIDTSKSMLTQDVRPNRLERVKMAVRDLLRKLRGDRLGIVVFAGDAFLACPLTLDYQGVLLTLADLNVNSVPRGGTNMEAALRVALGAHKDVKSKYKAIIILTDGENLEGDPVSVAGQARDKGIRIYTVGVGTREGDLIQINDSQGNREFLKDDQGHFIKSRLSEDLLQKIALTTGGVYVRQSGAELGLDLIYERELSKLEKREIESRQEKKYFERFQWPLAIALILLLIETCLSSRNK